MPEKFSQVLLDEFSRSDKARWRQQLKEDLPQKDYSDLIWRASKGIDLEPLYTRQEWLDNHRGQGNSNPDLFPKICENRAYSKVSTQDRAQLDLLEKIKMGADGVLLDLVDQGDQLPAILEKIDLAMTSITLVNSVDSEYSMAQLTSAAPSLESLKGSLYPIGLTQGSGASQDLEALAGLINNYPPLNDFKLLGISTPSKTNFSAKPTREMAFILASTVAHLESLNSFQCSYSQSFPSLEVQVNIGDSFFIEVGKIRALRFLLQKVGKLLGLKPRLASAFRIHADIQCPVKAAESGLIRTTTRAISAMLGGADSVCIKCDPESTQEGWAAFKIPSILKYESHFADLSDPCYGSYYIDEVTGLLAQKAWEEFQVIEGSGGIREYLNSNPDYLETHEA